MTELFLYSVKVAAVFSALVMCYHFYLRRLSFHFTNRVLLLLFIPISLYLPLLEFGTLYNFSNSNEFQSPFLNEASSYSSEIFKNEIIESGNGFLYYLSLFYLLGLVVFLLIFLINLLKILWLVKNSSLSNLSNIRRHDNNEYHIFSFFKWIFISNNQDLDVSHPIILHEEAHIKYWHSIDIILAELFFVFTWFNPFLLTYRKNLKEIHEYQADEYVLNQGIDKIEYLEIIKRAILEKQEIAFSSTFWSSNIKSRITMITKNKNKSRSYFRYLLVIPIAITMVFIMSGFTGSEPSIFPIKKAHFKKISSPFGVNRKTPYSDETQMHGGIDIAAELGTEVLATGSGKIIKSKDEGKWGNLIIIDHGNGIQTWYAHLNDLVVEEGDIVDKGDIIAHVGNTGQSTNPHLHYEVRKSGERVDPQLFYKMAE